MDWDLILSGTFLLSVVISGIRLGLPVMVACLGELITERSGVLNLGLEGIMSVGSSVGISVICRSFFLYGNTAVEFAVAIPTTLGKSRICRVHNHKRQRKGENFPNCHESPSAASRAFLIL